MYQEQAIETIEVRQASRIVNATARQAMANERARVLGLKVRRPSPQEEAAAQWQREQEARKRDEQQRWRTARQLESYPFSLLQVSLQVKGVPTNDNLGWRSYKPPPRAKLRPRRLGGIPVGSFATRLIQGERAGGGGVVADPWTVALGETARHWWEERGRNSG